MKMANYLRTKISCLARHVADLGYSDIADEARRILRRQLSVDQLESWLTDLEARMQPLQSVTVETPLSTEEMSGSNGQNVRHQHNSKKENTDKEVNHVDVSQLPAGRTLSLEDLTQACPEAASFLPEELSSPVDVIAHAKRLAPMIGIDRFCYETAERRLGALGAALTIWGLMERQNRISRFGAYFRSITSGNRSQSFDPWELINQLVKQASCISAHCPRTMPT